MVYLVLIALFFSSAAFAAPIPCVSDASLPAGIQCVDSGMTKNITAFSTCAAITNSHASSKPLMVPIKTSTEWSTFRSKLPAGVTSGACASTPQQILLSTPGSGSYSVPLNWNNSNNRLECVGAGGSGATYSSGGGGGGAYARSNNVTLTPGATFYYSIPDGSTGFADGAAACLGTADLSGGCSAANLVSAAGGQTGVNGSNPGLAANSLSNFVTYSGGTGGGDVGGSGGAGGGGSASPAGAGLKGGKASADGGSGGGGQGGGTAGAASTGYGGAAGGNGTAGSGGGAAGGGSGTNGGGGGGGISDTGAGSSSSNGGYGGVSTDMHPSMGTGGGGGGAGGHGNGQNVGGAGGPGGGGGGGSSYGDAGGFGGQGFCVLTYTP